jgi:hypothetical protein
MSWSLSLFTVGRRLGLVVGGSPAGALRIGSSVALRETARQTGRAAATVKELMHAPTQRAHASAVVFCWVVFVI